LKARSFSSSSYIGRPTDKYINILNEKISFFTLIFYSFGDQIPGHRSGPNSNQCRTTTVILHSTKKIKISPKNIFQKRTTTLVSVQSLPMVYYELLEGVNLFIHKHCLLAKFRAGLSFILHKLSAT
jgi:hypothetical protein